jgi:TonB family protein
MVRRDEIGHWNPVRLWPIAACALACGVPDEPIEQPTPMPGTSAFEYPVGLWDQRLEGETMLMVHVTELGQVDSAYVLDTSGFREFDSAAVAGARRLQFSAGSQGGRRIAMWTKVPVRFSLDTTAPAEPPAGDSAR